VRAAFCIAFSFAVSLALGFSWEASAVGAIGGHLIVRGLTRGTRLEAV
jgi:hypothetical protein